MTMHGRWEGEALVVRMLRFWRAARSIGENPLPHMQAQVAPFVPSPEFVSACDSLFSLTEAVVGRPLVTARCCSALPSRDEAAVLAVLRHAAAAGSIHTSWSVPHGLPEALRRAAFAVLRALTDRIDLGDPVAAPARCPFGTAALDQAA
jgi:hypothetical protein